MAVKTFLKPWQWKQAVTSAMANYIGVKNEPIVDLRSGKPELRVSNGITKGGILLKEPPIIGIVTPTVLYPENGAGNLVGSPIIIGSTFQGIDASLEPVIHLHTYWQIATDIEFINLIVDSGWITTLTVLDLAVLGVVLTEGQPYYVRLKHQSHYGSESEWSPVSELTPAAEVPSNLMALLYGTDTSKSDQYGRSISISEEGNVLAVGAMFNDQGKVNSGSLYIHYLEDGIWSNSIVLNSQYTVKNNQMGKSLSISKNGKVVVAGGSGSASVNLFIFEETGDKEWTERETESPPGITSNEKFGYAVATNSDGSVVAVSAPSNWEYGSNAGTVLIYHRLGDVWNHFGTIYADDASSNDYFGWSLDISGDGSTLFIGARSASGANSSSAGCVYVYNISTGNAAFITKLSSLDGVGGDYFGGSISSSKNGKTAIVGAYRDDDFGGDTGSAYVFNLIDGNWEQSAKILPTDPKNGDRFGFAVSLTADGTVAAISSHFDDDNGSNSGSTYVFQLQGDVWTQVNKLKNPNGKANDYFGYSLAISGSGNLAIGCYGDDDRGGASGSVLIYSK